MWFFFGQMLVKTSLRTRALTESAFLLLFASRFSADRQNIRPVDQGSRTARARRLQKRRCEHGASFVMACHPRADHAPRQPPGGSLVRLRCAEHGVPSTPGLLDWLALNFGTAPNSNVWMNSAAIRQDPEGVQSPRCWAKERRICLGAKASFGLSDAAVAHGDVEISKLLVPLLHVQMSWVVLKAEGWGWRSESERMSSEVGARCLGSHERKCAMPEAEGLGVRR